ncbi:hypothetical protein [Streptomyces sp. CT34]|nr:hypothetical protein [Streptomyces sp. CT34]
MDGIPFRTRTGVPWWRDVPERYGP